ncbi:MAG: hypothetical protein ACRDCW_15655 [Sarcina sp.]
MSTDTKKLERVLLDKDYTDGKVSGVINKRIKTGIIIRIERGIYKFIEGYKFGVKSVTKAILENAVGEINENLSKVDITALDDKEFEDIREIRKLMKSLEEFYKVIIKNINFRDF